MLSRMRVPDATDADIPLALSELLVGSPRHNGQQDIWVEKDIL